MAETVTKAFILAGGQGTRLSEETALTPKPLVKVDGTPVIIYVMRRFYQMGIKDIYLLCGYKVDAFKRYFEEYMSSGNDMIYTRYGAKPINESTTVEDWNVRILDTGENATTSQRVNHIRKYVAEGEPFFLTYGDSVSDVNPQDIIDLHFSASSGKDVTVTAVNRSERFGILRVNEETHKVERFAEKSDNAEELINGGYIVCDHAVLDEVNEKSGDFSHETLTKLANEGRMNFYKHTGFWHPMDTKRDVDNLTELHQKNPHLF